MAETQTPDDISQVMRQNQQIQPQNLVQNQKQNPIPIPQIQQPQQQAFIVYAPQMYQAKPQPYTYNQIQPIQYPQFQQPPQYAQVIQPPKKVTPPEIPLKHEELSLAGKLERRYFHLQTLSFFLMFQALAFILCLVSYHNGLVYISYGPAWGGFKAPFYISLVVMILSSLYSYTNTKKLRNPSWSKALAVIYALSYAFFIQALYSSTYYHYTYTQNHDYYYLLDTNGGDVIVIMCYSFINLQIFSLFSYSIQELDHLNFKGSFGYIVLPSLTFGGILFAFYDNYDVIVGMTFFFIGFGFYFQYILTRLINSTKFKLRSDDGLYSAVLLSFLIFVPFFENGTSKSDEMIQESQSDSFKQENAQ